MTVQYSIQKMVSDGTLSTIVLGVQYLQRNDMYMRIAGVEIPQSGSPSGYTWSFLDNNTIRVLPVVPAGVEVVVYRRTDLDVMYNVYSQNAQFDESTIDENNQQLLYIAQEYFEQGVPAQLIESVEYVREDTTNIYYRLKLSDGKYTAEFPVPKGEAAGFDALRRTYADAGLTLVDGSFETGGVLGSTTDVLLHNVTAKAYAWSGAFPKVVPAVSTPTPLGAGGWIDQSDVVLRSQLASSAGVTLVGNAADKRGQKFTGRVSASSVQVGDVVLTGDALRDGVVVARVNAGATNIHGFADRTQLTAVSDYGGYGAFDSTVVVSSSSSMDHTFSFQHRVAYDGDGGGTIGKIAGLLSAPTIYAGTVEEHAAVRIGNPDIKPGATLNQNIGVDIGALFGAGAIVGLKMSVDVPLAYNIYQPGYSKNYFAGAVGINDIDVTYKGEPLRLKGYGVGAQSMAFNTTATEAHIGFAAADSFMKFYTGGQLGFQLTPTTTYEGAFTPGSDNLQPLGTMPYRWKVVVAGTGAIVTSDERAKTEIRGLTAEEIAAGVEIGNARKLYKLRQSVDEKGSNGARWHCGWIAQEVQAIMEKHGLNPFRYGFFCHDEWPDELDSGGNVAVSAGERYSLRYDELLCFVDAAKYA